MGKVSDLPNELLRYLFLMLSPEDLKAIVLVSRRWRKVGEDPVLWKWCWIYIFNAEDIIKLYNVRFHHVREINVNTGMVGWQTSHFEEMLQATLELPKLTKIGGVPWLDLSFVNSELLGRALVRQEELSLMGNDHTTNHQRFAIFTKMLVKSCVKKLNLIRVNLGILEMEAELLAKIMTDLQELVLTNVSLTNDQAEKLFKSISENNRLNMVKFDSLNVTSVKPEMFGIALTKIENVRLERMEISPFQARALFTEMGHKGRIKSFSAYNTNLSATHPKSFARGLAKLEKIELDGINFTDDQLRAVFAELSQKCGLKCLKLAFNDLSSVDPNDLATAVINIEDVDLCDTQLSTEQITAVLTRTQQITKLKKLNIIWNDISDVDPALVTTAREKLEQLLILNLNSESEDDESDEDDSLDSYDSDDDDSYDTDDDDSYESDDNITGESDPEVYGYEELDSSI